MIEEISLQGNFSFLSPRFLLYLSHQYSDFLENFFFKRLFDTNIPYRHGSLITCELEMKMANEYSIDSLLLLLRVPIWELSPTVSLCLMGYVSPYPSFNESSYLLYRHPTGHDAPYPLLPFPEMLPIAFLRQMRYDTKLPLLDMV